jgi:hypothetical protein
MTKRRKRPVVIVSTDYDYAAGAYEPMIVEAMVLGLGPGSVFYDVGAHIGVFSLLAARIAGPTLESSTDRRAANGTQTDGRFAGSLQ